MRSTRSSEASLVGLGARRATLGRAALLALAVAGVVAACTSEGGNSSTSSSDGWSSSDGCRNYFTSTDLASDQQFTQPLPIPNRIKPTYTDPEGTDDGRPVYVLHARDFTWEPREGVCIQKWGFEGTTPGPTLTAKPDQEIEVLVYNELPGNLYNPYLDPLNPAAWKSPPAPNRTFYSMIDPSAERPPAPFDAAPYAQSQYELDPDLTVHLHGGHQTPENDGYPMDTFEPGASETYTYPNNQLPTTLWYHDHDMDHTRGHVLMGLAGFYLIEDKEADKQLGLPIGTNCEATDTPIPSSTTTSLTPTNPGACDEIPIMFQAVPAEMIDDDAYQPVAYGKKGSDQPTPYEVLWTANNTIAPYLTVENKPYRLRLLNGNDELPLTVWTSTEADDPESYPDGAYLQQVGTDGGLMNRVAVASPPQETKVRLFPAQRADVVLDFSDIRTTTTIYLQAATGQAFVGGPEPKCITTVCEFGDDVDQAGHALIKFVVEPTLEPPPPAFDPTDGLLRAAGRDPIVKIPIEVDGKPVPERSFLFAFNGHVGHNPFATINGRYFDPKYTAATPVVGTTEVWKLVNSTDGYHPIHIHDIEFQVVSRAMCPVTNPTLVGTQTDPDTPYNWCEKPRSEWETIAPQPGDWADCQKDDGAAERCNLGWKDVFVIPPYSEVTVIGTFTDNLGTYVFHCHNLIHEDAGMMGQFEVVADESQNHSETTQTVDG